MNLTAYITSALIVNRFLIEFENANCPHFLSLTGDHNKNAHLTRNGQYITLAVYNTSQNIQIYTSSNNSSFVFHWPSKTIDGAQMNLTHSRGSSGEFKFKKLIVSCPFKQIQTEELTKDIQEQPIYHTCDDTEKFVVYCIPVIVIFCLLTGVKIPTIFDFLKIRYQRMIPLTRDTNESNQRETVL